MARTKTSLSRTTSPSSNFVTSRLSKGRQTTTRSSSSCAKHSQTRSHRRQLNFARQLLAFAVTMQTGDVVILPRKLTSQIAMGRVTGPYRFSHVNSEDRHTRRVEWLQTDIPRTTFEAGPSLLVRRLHDGMQHLQERRGPACRSRSRREGRPRPVGADRHEDEGGAAD